MAGLKDDDARFAYLAEGNAKQARKRVAADVLLRDQRGHIVLVNPTYKEHWDLPGGMAENNEAPRAAAVREVGEELGLSIEPGRVLVLDWIGAHGPWDDQLLFIFDGGVLSDGDAEQLAPRDPEISEVALVPLQKARQLLRADMAERVERAFQALARNTTDYAEGPW
ncbi:ADP-ribose pyrophosphatase YjhB, NUDIX family [Lentzea xinjiangensis]|uniref:ADP-ribose pyrophosphatase YjhB, NUDIX family n=1 Tax=Lentzea xinjiangensis TaxID=402600 RepID=A0A1H9S065_9PSEU|nr:NUDIX hydrolase [Lentzea xinjiangensis]SER77723.1 ADP-ribose pyrophosphatase YjhB, NUDIX family [Lentzea xinjiangensis]